jgi:hypothetical protein
MGGWLVRPYQQRVVEELSALQTKCEKLAEFLMSDLFKTVDNAEGARLVRQHGVMVEYCDILKDRIENFK